MEIPDRPNPNDRFRRVDIIAWWAELSVPDDGSKDRNIKLRREKERLRKQLLRAFPPNGDDRYELEFGKVTAFFLHPPERYRNAHTFRLMEIANGVPATIDLTAILPFPEGADSGDTRTVEVTASASLTVYPSDTDELRKGYAEVVLRNDALERENRELRVIKEKCDRLMAKQKKHGKDGGRGNQK